MQREVVNRADEGHAGHTEVKHRAVVGGACVGFVVGMVGLTLTWDITELWTLWDYVLDMSSFDAITVAAASGGVVTAVLADTDVESTGLNIVLADLLSSLIAVATVIFGFTLATQSVTKALTVTLFSPTWGLFTVLPYAVFSMVVALGAGLATYGSRRWWRDFGK